MSGLQFQASQRHRGLQHDFLWRTTRDLPERGRIGIFNRSYYEEVLIVRVHPDILQNEGLPHQKHVWHSRYRSINDLERHLHDNGMRIVKFFLHLSKDEQRKRFLQRIDEPAKNWKFSLADIEERAFWDDYMAAYEECLGATSTRDAPWYVVPADDKHTTRLIVSQIILDTIAGLDLRYPEASAERVTELQAIRKRLWGDDGHGDLVTAQPRQGPGRIVEPGDRFAHRAPWGAGEALQQVLFAGFDPSGPRSPEKPSTAMVSDGTMMRWTEGSLGMGSVSIVQFAGMKKRITQRPAASRACATGAVIAIV